MGSQQARGPDAPGGAPLHAPRAAPLDGPLTAVLEEGWAPLPNRTLLALVVGGLRVRMMRSIVTMISIVLAIAFLSYTGFTSGLHLNLARKSKELGTGPGDSASVDAGRAAAARLKIKLRRAGVNVRATLEGGHLDTWLITMALLTCAVGITNAMLMSVTERFREIGTMKCLGAEDSLIVKMFLLESAMLGLVGAVLGVVLGVAVALAAGVVQFGGYGASLFPVAGGLKVVGWSLLGGLVLAVAGGVYPSIVAARMQPVDALRVDE